MNLVAPSQMCLIVLSEKGLYLINGNLLLLFPSLSNPPSVDKMRPISLTDIFAKIAEGFIAKWMVQDIQGSVAVW